MRFFSLPVMRQFPFASTSPMVAGVKTSIAQHSGRLFRAPPVTGENIRTPDNDLAVLAKFHFDARNSGAHASWFDAPRNVQRADPGGFNDEAVALQEPGIPSIMKNSCVSRARGAEPQIIARRFGPRRLRMEGKIRRPASPSQKKSQVSGVLASSRNQASCARSKIFAMIPPRLRRLSLMAGSHSLQQQWNVQEVVGFGGSDFVGQLGEIHRKRKHALPGQTR